MIQISTETANAVATSTGSIVGGLWNIEIILIGIVVAFFVIRRLLQVLPRK